MQIHRMRTRLLLGTAAPNQVGVIGRSGEERRLKADSTAAGGSYVLAIPAAILAPPSLQPFAHQHWGHPQGGDGVGPPPAERRVEADPRQGDQRQPPAGGGLE